MPRLLQATYFPFTSVATSLLEVLSCCLDRVTLYQAVGSPLVQDLQPWVENGFLDIRVPFAGIIDENAVTAAIRNWKTWGATHQKADLAYLKEVAHKVAPVEPLTPKVASEIRGTATGRDDKPDDHDLTVQLFLLLALEFDQQSREVAAQLTSIEKQKQALQAFFRIDRPDEKDMTGQQWLQAREDLGGFMAKTRMIAWNHLFQKDPVPSSVLITDSPSAFSLLLAGLEEQTESFRFELAYSSDPSDTLIWKDRLQGLFDDLLTRPWDSQTPHRVQEVCNEITPVPPSDGKQTGEDLATKVVFRWHVLPHGAPVLLLNQRFGQSRGSPYENHTENTLVGLVEVGCP